MYRINILIADRDEARREEVASYFDPQAFNVLTLGSGGGVMRIIREEKPSTVIMDVALEERDGILCCQDIRADPELDNVRVIVLSPEDDPDPPEMYLALGANLVLRRPIGMETMTRLVESLSQDERREHARYPIRCQVRVSSASKDFKENTSDLSLGGMFIETSERLPVGTGVEIQLIFDSDDPSMSPVFRGRVVHVRLRGEAAKRAELLENEGLGVQFVRLEDDSLRQLHYLIDQELRNIRKDVVIVEDGKDLLRKMSGYLSRYEVTVAPFRRGLDLLDRYPLIMPRVLVLRIIAPEINGLELVRTIYKRFPRHRPRVIFLAGDEYEKVRPICAKLGAAVIRGRTMKPVQLLQAVREGLATRRPPQGGSRPRG